MKARDIYISFDSFQIGVSGPELRHLKLPRKTAKSLSQLVQALVDSNLVLKTGIVSAR